MNATADRSGFRPIKLLAQQLATVTLDLLFPRHCVNCERVGSFLCERCMRTVTPAPHRDLSSLDGVQSAVNYHGAAISAIHAFKYDGHKDLATLLGEWLVCVLDATWQIDMVTAVPLHSARESDRGYNQAALLAAYVAARRGWPFVCEAVSRVRETQSQVSLDAAQRQINVAGAFAAQSDHVKGKRVLLIDDVLTTGATLVACASALYEAGAARVFGATVASAVYAD